MSDFWNKVYLNGVNGFFKKGFYDAKDAKVASGSIAIQCCDDLKGNVSVTKTPSGMVVKGDGTYCGLFDDKNALKIGFENTAEPAATKVKGTGELKLNQVEAFDFKASGSFERTTPTEEGAAHTDDWTAKFVVDAPLVDNVDLHVDVQRKSQRWEGTVVPVMAVNDDVNAAIKINVNQDKLFSVAGGVAGKHDATNYYVTGEMQRVAFKDVAEAQEGDDAEATSGNDYSVVFGVVTPGPKENHQVGIKVSGSCKNGEKKDDNRETVTDWSAEVGFKTKVEGADVGVTANVRTFVVGLAYVNQFASNTKFTLNATVDGKNLASDNHNLSIALEL